MVTRPADVVQHRQQRAQHVGQGLLTDGHPVALDALAVVGVLRVHALQVRGALSQLAGQAAVVRTARLDAGVARGAGGPGAGGCAVFGPRAARRGTLRARSTGWLSAGRLAAAGPALRPALRLAVLALPPAGPLARVGPAGGVAPRGTAWCHGAGPSPARLGRRVPSRPGRLARGAVAAPLRIPDLAGHRVDAPEVTDHRPIVGVLWRIHQAAPPSPACGLSSSTISASTTSSSSLFAVSSAVDVEVSSAALA